MKNLKNYILEGSSNVVPVEALMAVLKDFNPDVYNDIYFIDMLTMEYKVSQDMAEALIRTLGDAVMDEAVEIDPKICDDLFSADKIIKKEVDSNFYLAVHKHGNPTAWAVSITSRRQNQRELAAVLDNIQWKPSKHNVFYNFK